jgi:DNA polymerase-3 subunit gamma/tau
MTAWHLTYRPQTIADLDCVPAREALLKFLNAGKFPSALLFLGPRGIGKTSAARIIAKTVNCRKNKDGIVGEPCNVCDQCLAITRGSHLDVIEIDGASNRGIDDIRELRERVKLAPTVGKYRVYIIDEVHMLTNEAFNALLKTLEEPPVSVIFILCTTDPQKIPETISSRATKVYFRKGTPQELLVKLQRVAAAEKLTADPEGLKLIAKEARGSYRDGVKLLEQTALSGSVTVASARSTVGQAESARPLKLLEFLLTRDTREAIREVDRAVEAGVNLKSYIEEMTDIVRQMMLARIDLAEEELPVELASTPLSIAEADHLIRLLTGAYTGLREAVLPQLPLELAVLEWCNPPDENKESGHGKAAGVSPQRPKSPPERKEAEPAVTSAATSLPDGEVPIDRIFDHWQEVLKKIRPKNFSIEALLKSCRPLSIEEGSLVVEVYYSFHKDRLESEKFRRIVEDVLNEVMGFPLRLQYRLSDRQANKPDEAVPANKDDISGLTVGDDILKAAAEIFKGTVVE